MRLIDADALRYEISKLKYPEARINMILAECVNKSPTIDVAPVVRGEWIEDGDMQICSNCGEEHSWEEYRASYCEDCGAKMEEKS